jgi:hypothetical protein
MRVCGRRTGSPLAFNSTALLLLELMILRILRLTYISRSLVPASAVLIEVVGVFVLVQRLLESDSKGLLKALYSITLLFMCLSAKYHIVLI